EEMRDQNPVRVAEPSLPHDDWACPQLRGLIQLTKDGLTCPSDLSHLTHEFSQQHTLRLPQLLHPDLTRLILREMDRGAWTPYDHGQIARELQLDSAPALGILNFVVNTPEFLKTVARITQCGPISLFTGRVY